MPPGGVGISQRMRMMRLILHGSIFGYPTGDKNLDSYLKKAGWKYDTWGGTVSFLPAFPVKTDFKAVVDIVTSHHPDYYKDGGTCYDTQNPVPLPFPVIEAGSSFKFVIRSIEIRAAVKPD